MPTSEEGQLAVITAAGRMVLVRITPEAMRALAEAAGGTQKAAEIIASSWSLLQAVAVEKLTLRRYEPDEEMAITLSDVAL